MVEFSNLTGAIGLECLFQGSRADPRLVATNADRRAFAASVVMVAILPLDVIGLLQTKRPVGFVRATTTASTNGPRALKPGYSTAYDR